MTKYDIIKHLSNSNIDTKVFSLLLHNYLAPACHDCKHHLSKDGNYPTDPCGECSRFYGDQFERKNDV